MKTIVEPCDCPGCLAVQTQTSSEAMRIAARLTSSDLMAVAARTMLDMTASGMTSEQKITVWELSLLHFTTNLLDALDKIKNGEEQ